MAVTETPLYLRSSPELPPIRAYDPSGFHETVQKLSPVETPVGIEVSEVPSYLSSTAESPEISAYDPSGFQLICRSWVVTGWPIRVNVPFEYSRNTFPSDEVTSA